MVLGVDKENKINNEMKTRTCFSHKADEKKTNKLLSVFLLKAHQYITPCPLKHYHKGREKKNVILNIAPSSFLKCDSVYDCIQLS